MKQKTFLLGSVLFCSYVIDEITKEYIDTPEMFAYVPGYINPIFYNQTDRKIYIYSPNYLSIGVNNENTFCDIESAVEFLKTYDSVLNDRTV